MLTVCHRPDQIFCDHMVKLNLDEQTLLNYCTSVTLTSADFKGFQVNCREYVSAIQAKYFISWNVMETVSSENTLMKETETIPLLFSEILTNAERLFQIKPFQVIV